MKAIWEKSVIQPSKETETAAQVHEQCTEMEEQLNQMRDRAAHDKEQAKEMIAQAKAIKQWLAELDN